MMETRTKGAGFWPLLTADAAEEAITSNVRIFLAGALEATASYISKGDENEQDKGQPALASVVLDREVRNLGKHVGDPESRTLESVNNSAAHRASVRTLRRQLCLHEQS